MNKLRLLMVTTLVPAAVAGVVASSFTSGIGSASAAVTPQTQTNEDFREERRLREEFGLRSDDQHIRDVRASHDAGRRQDDTYGVLLTPAEGSEIRFRERVMDEDAQRIRGYFESRSSDFSGLFYDHQANRLVAAVVHDADAHKAALRAVVRHSDRLDVRQAAHSADELEAAHAKIAERWDDYKRDGVDLTALATSEIRNVVIVSVAGDPQAARARLERDVNGALLEVRQSGIEPTIGRTVAAPITGTPYRNSPPFRGGQIIVRNGVTNSECTTGFIGYRNTVPATFSVLTAGHCARPSTCWAQGPQGNTTTLGCVSSTTWPAGTNPGRTADGARITFASAADRSNDYVAGCCPESYRDVLAEANLTETLGSPVCQYGFRTVSSCGTWRRETR